MRFSNIFAAERRIEQLEKPLGYLYAIRHKSTGRFLPRPPSGQKGGSWVEPAYPHEQIPRFFYKEPHAKGFLTSWCKGPQVRRVSVDWDTGIEECDGTKPEPNKAEEPRVKEDWEVIRIHWGVTE